MIDENSQGDYDAFLKIQSKGERQKRIKTQVGIQMKSAEQGYNRPLQS